MGARNGGGRRLKFAESTLALATIFAAATAQAGDLTISNSNSTAIDTNGANNGPGNITIQSGGSVNVTTPVAVTIDSSNTVTNAGEVSTSAESGAIAIRGLLTAPDGVTPLNLTSGITNTGTISVPGPASTSSLFNNNVFNAGIRLDGAGTFTGNILNDVGGNITVGGNNSYGILINAPMVGNITNNATITAASPYSYGVATAAPVNGSIVTAGSITAEGLNGTGMYIGGPVSGQINIGGPANGVTTGGTITVGTPPSTDANGNPIFQTPGTAALWIASSVNQGLLITGPGYTQAEETPTVQPGQSVTVNGTIYTPGQTYTNPNIDTTSQSTISNQGGGPALLIKPGGPGALQNIVIGAQPNSQYSIVNRGVITASSTLPRNTNAASVNPYINPYGFATVTNPAQAYVNVPGLDATGVDIEGATSGSTVYTANLSGGFQNIANVDATATNATAIGIKIDNHGMSSTIANTGGDILVNANDTTYVPTLPSAGTLGGDAYGVYVGPTGALNSFYNSGHITVISQGLGHSAYGVLDLSGTLSNFTNAGDIAPEISAFNTTGSAVAVDLSHNTSGVTFTNTGSIEGPVLLGSGTNTVTYTGGTQTGALSFTGGTNTVSISNSKLTGNITLGGGSSNVSITNGSKVVGGVVSTGSANLTVSQANLTIPDTSLVKVTNATINSGSTVTFDLNGQGGNTGVIAASGSVSVANGATLNPVFTGVVTAPQTVNLISSSSLNLGAPVSSLVSGNDSYMTAYTVQLDPTNPNDLQLTARRRTPAEMGLGTNMGAAYDASIPALALDRQVGGAIAQQATKAQFVSAFRQLMPDTTDAIRQTALANQNLALGAVRRRLQGVPNASDTAEADVGSFWGQALVTSASASNNGSNDTQPGYSYWGVGVAVGADTPIGSSTKVGASVCESFNSVDLGVSKNSFLVMLSSQANLYARQDLGRFYVQAIGGGGVNNYSEERDLAIGTLTRTATGKSNGYQYGGSVEGGVRLEAGEMGFTPYLRAGYLKLHAGGFSEKNGGPGVDLTVGPRDTDSLRTTAGFNLGKDYVLSYDSFLEVDVRGSVTHDFRNNPITFTSSFSAAGAPFTTISTPHGPNIYSGGISIGHKDSFSAITLDYDAEVASHFIGHTAAVTLRFRF